MRRRKMPTATGLVAALATAVLLATSGSAGAAVSAKCGSRTATIKGTDGADVLRGTSGPDVIQAGAGNDVVTGAAGNDTICGGVGNDRLSGGPGSDHIYGQGGLDTIDGGGGNDVIDAGVGNDLVSAGAGNDVVTGGAGNDRVFGNAGNDTITGAAGDDRLNGGLGADKITGATGNDTLLGAGGADKLTGGSGNDRLVGGAGNDVVTGGDGNDSLAGNAGNDTVTGGAGNDTVTGGNGNDKVSGDAGNDDIYGNAGDDTLIDLDGSNAFYPGTGHDTVKDGAQASTVQGDPPADCSAPVDPAEDAALTAAAAEMGLSPADLSGLSDPNPACTAGDASQFATDVSPISDDFCADCADPTPPDTGTVDDQIDTGGGNDVVIDDAGNDQVSTGDGNDVALVGDGNDQVDAGAGNDQVDLGAGDDQADLGTGTDAAEGEGGNDTIGGGAGNDGIDGGAGNDQLGGGDGRDLVDGQDGNDTENGGNGRDGLTGGAGNDNLAGEQGGDSACGGAGNDTLTGGTSPDALRGGEGEDAIDGGSGDDSLYGDAGADNIQGSPGYDTAVGDNDTTTGCGQLVAVDETEPTTPPPSTDTCADVEEAAGCENRPGTADGTLPPAVTRPADVAGCTAYAAPYGDDGDPGTSDAPFRTVEFLVNSLRAGGVGCLKRAGAFTESDQEIDVRSSGAPGAPILIRYEPGAPANSAPVTGRLYVSSSVHDVELRGLVLNGRNTLAKLRGLNAALPSPTVDGDAITFTGNDVTTEGTATCFIVGSVLGYGRADDIVISRNRIHDCGVKPSPLPPSGDHGIDLEASTNARISDNAIFDNADRGILLYPDAQGTLIEHNVIDSNGRGITFGAEIVPGSGWDPAYAPGSKVFPDGTTVTGNVISRSTLNYTDPFHWQVEGFLGWTPPPGPASNAVTANCFALGDGSKNIQSPTIGFSASGNTQVATAGFVNAAGKDFTLSGAAGTCSPSSFGVRP